MTTALPLQPPVLPMLQGVAGALRADLAARPTSAALNGGALPEGGGLVLKRPSGQPPCPSPNLTQGQGRAECWEGGGLGCPDPSPPPKLTVGEGQDLPLPAARCPDGGAPPERQGAMGDHNHPLPKASARSPPLLQKRSEEVAQGLGLRPAPEGHGVMGEHGVADPPRAGYKGALQGLGLWPARGGGEKRRGAASSNPPLTGASSRAQGNPARRARAPRRRLHGRASSEVT